MNTPNDPPQGPGTDDVLAALERRFAQRRAPSPSPAAMPPGRNPYELAAAVLHVFDPKRLRPYGMPSSREDPFTLLFEASVPAVGWRHQRLRSLRPEVRRAALEQLGSRREMRNALDANPERTTTALQALFERWVDGEPPALEQLTHAQLESFRELYDWGLERFGPLPDHDSFEEARMRRAAVGVFEHLVDASFTGRDAELQMLRDYVGVSSPSRWARLRRFLSDKPQAPLVIVGPGGTGKTALIGRFLMDHVESAKVGWFPFAYLAFDSDTLDVREPFTVLLAAASQLEAQLHYVEGAGPDERIIRRARLDNAFVAFRSAVEDYRDKRGKLRQRAQSSAGELRRLPGFAEAEYRFNVSFGKLLTEISDMAGAQQGASQVPVLLVLDTFEEVLYRTNEELRGLWGMLETVQAGFPALRVVIASRTQPRPFSIARRQPAEHPLRELDERDAVSLLRHLGVDDTEVARTIVRQVGGNPLTLRLAARVARDEEVGAEGIRRLKTRRYFLFDVAPELIRGQLYRRVLDHIHDDDVRALAHPGMVLRRVTADIIQHVLAPICGLEDVDGTRAEELFEHLGREHALVSIEDPGSLRYRDEVRRPLLELLKRDKPEEVKRIHEAAMTYYHRRDRPDPVERAEELYHLLMQGAERTSGVLTNALSERWMPGLEGRLSSAVDEIPVEQRVLLANQMSIELPPHVYQLASVASWERLIGRKALDALRYQGPEAVLELLATRVERTPESPLHAVEARALLAMDNRTKAAAVLDHALEGYPAVGNVGRLAELLWIRAQTALSDQDPLLALSTLQRLAKLARTMRSPLTQVQALTELVAVKDTLESQDVNQTRDALAAALAKMSDHEVDMERSLVRLALARLGPGYPTTLRRLLPFVRHDWLEMARDRGDLSYVARIVEALLVAFRRQLPQVVEGLLKRDRPLDQVVQRFASEVFDRAVAEDSDGLTTGAAFLLLRAERATLREANLAGIDSYREPWELAAAPEVSA